MTAKYISEVPIQAVSLAPFEALLGVEEHDRLEAGAEKLRTALSGRTVWTLNSTAAGGGVAEMLQPIVGYGRGAGVDVRWLVVGGDSEFFAITKRIHNFMHGSPGDGGSLGTAEQDHYQEVLRHNADELRSLLRPGDPVILHDPQTAGLIPHVRAAGALPIWRSHIGVDTDNPQTREAWEFLRPSVEQAELCIFTRPQYVPSWLELPVIIVPPSIDPFSAKNQELSDDVASAVLVEIGLVRTDHDADPVFMRRDGSPGRVDRVADIIGAGPAPDPDVPMVVQVSRWDRLKDMAGVMRAFADRVVPATNAHLVLAGPNVSGVADDPEGEEVLQECIDLWRNLPAAARSRITLACLPTDDLEENAIMVNALQRHASIVIQKSLAEGFGLTVTEAMWKGRTVVASALGGIGDQIVDNEHGRLVPDPRDLEAFGDILVELLNDPERLEALGVAARERVLREFLTNRHMLQYIELLASLQG